MVSYLKGADSIFRYKLYKMWCSAVYANDLVIELLNTLLNTLLITNYLLHLSDH